MHVLQARRLVLATGNWFLRVRTEIHFLLRMDPDCTVLSDVVVRRCVFIPGGMSKGGGGRESLNACAISNSRSCRHLSSRLPCSQRALRTFQAQKES